jgi:hypothetical protein
MILEIKTLDVDGDFLENFSPESLENFCILMAACIGQIGSPGGDDFWFRICTPAWLQAQCLKQPVIWGRHMIIIDRYNAETIKAELEKIVKNCKADSWEAAAEKLGRMGAWEFEDYAE